MAYRSHHCSTTLRYSVCISVFCTLLTLSVLIYFYALCTMSLQCTIPLLYISTAALCLLLHTSITLNRHHPNLFFVLHSYNLCAPCACNMCHVPACSPPPIFFHIRVFTHTYLLHLFPTSSLNPLCLLLLLLMSSTLPDHHCNSSASLAVPPTRLASLGVMLRFLSPSGS